MRGRRSLVDNYAHARATETPQVITRDEWLRVPLEARLIEHANHCEDELLRDDLIQAVKKIDKFAEQVATLNVEVTRLERLAASPTPY